MFIAILEGSRATEIQFVDRLRSGGFRVVDIPALVPDSGIFDKATSVWGSDFRIRLLKDQLDPLMNHVFTGVRNIQELLALRRIRPTALLLMDQQTLSNEQEAQLASAGLPVGRVTSDDCYHGDKCIGSLMEVTHRMARMDWDAYFMSIAQIVATRSDCVKRSVAAIIVRDHHIIATGYNGTPKGTVNCSEGGCPRCSSFGPSGTSLGECLCSHGEENAIMQAAYHGVSVKGASIYCTTSPCLLCTKMIINSGIREVVYNSAYTLGERSLSLLKEAGVTRRQFEG